MPFRPVHAWTIAGVFLVVGASTMHGIWDSGKTINERKSIDLDVIAVRTVRSPILQPMTDATESAIRCSDCHAGLEVPEVPPRHEVAVHEKVLNHGNNDFCFNCHAPKDRDSLLGFDGNAVPFEHSDLVCAKCHAAVHRDWESGAHGRLNGYWQAGTGPQSKAACVACHDPHDPRFKPLQPAPAPVPSDYTTKTWGDCGRCHPWISKILQTAK